jgi:hypothetical protein
MAFCSKCGAQIADGAKFCNACGAAQTQAQPQNPNPNQGYNYNQGYNPQFTGVPRTPVKTDRSLLMYILLTLVTCGIYGWIFIYELAKDVNQMCQEDGDKVGGLGAYIFLSLITCGIYSWYWMYKVQNRLNAAGPRYGVQIPENGTTVILWYVVGMLICAICSFIGMNIVIKSANKVGAAYNAKYFYNQNQF